ncbi:MAG: hypothetical protein K0B08_02175 [Bacteroidales bacterium]|nr:hypothetical protein [Bacteroidales bacterium]
MNMKLSITWAAIALLAALIFLGSYYTDRLLAPFLDDFLDKNKPLKHHITYENFRLNLVNRQMQITGIRMIPDTSWTPDENVWMEIHVSSLKLTQFRVMKFLIHKKLMIGDLILIEPRVIVHLLEKQPDKLRDAMAETTANKINLASFKSLSLKNILLADGEFKLYREEDLTASSSDLDFSGQDISFERGETDQRIIMHFGESSTSIKDIAWHSKTTLYTIYVDELLATNIDSTILIHNIRVSPNFSKTDFTGMIDFQEDRFDIQSGKITINRIGYERMLAGHPAEISKLLIEHLEADIYRDKNIARNSHKYPEFFNESFLKIPFPLVLDTLSIVNAVIQYGELAEGKDEPGVIRLEEFTAMTTDLRNFRDSIRMKTAMNLKIRTKVMGEGILDAELQLPLEGDLHRFACKGSVGAMALAPLNAMLEPAINMRLNSGTLTRMTFDFKADDHESNGWMEFLYQDLDVVILKKNPDKQWGFLSTLANTAVLSNNPQPGKEAKIVEIGYERDKNKGIINYIWKTIQSGLVRTIVPV